jgi:hypothetical protein
MGFLILLVIGAVIAGGIGYWIAGEKNRDGVEGAALGCILGPIGWIIEAVLPTKDPAPRNVTNSYAPASRSRYAGTETQRVVIPDYLQVPFEQHPDSRRPRGGKDGRPRIWLTYPAPTAQGAVDSLVKGELSEYAKSGKRVVEAAWSSADQPRIVAAFGDPNGQYALLFENKPRVVWDSKVGAEPAPTEAEPVSAPTASTVPEPPVTPRSEPARPVPAAVPPTEAAPLGSAEPADSARPTKKCPDCAETILADARICKHCRYEFWPRPE